MSWRAEKDELVAANGDFEQPLFVWMKRQRAEVEAALLYFDRNLSRGHAAHIDRDIRVARAKPAGGTETGGGPPFGWPQSPRPRGGGPAARASGRRLPPRDAGAARRSS